MAQNLVVAKAQLIEIYEEIDRAKTLLAAGGLIFCGHSEPTEQLDALGEVLNVVDNVLEAALEKVDAFWEPAIANA
jgi:hypothetical protein